MKVNWKELLIGAIIGILFLALYDYLKKNYFSKQLGTNGTDDHDCGCGCGGTCDENKTTTTTTIPTVTGSTDLTNANTSPQNVLKLY